jgi:peptidoglycan/xylan/chitin deacetylase (PgdA/CDA1 family)
MKLFKASLISTILIIAIGAGLASQVFLTVADVPKQTVMISVNMNDERNLPQWCDELSTFLETSGIKATVFVTGKIAETYPECISSLAANKRLDIGSQTYNYVSLPSIPDYSIKLKEVQNGKSAVDSAGKINSRFFKAPLGKTDDDVYSLLNRSSILADFSYRDHYNKYYQGYYIWFNVTSFDVTGHEASFYQTLAITDTPVIINFDNHNSVEQLKELVSQLKSSHFNFVNASDLTHLELTVRGEDQV